jgi:cyclopropane fatty-acyl-phospholipid synthase-like methyltransferase
MDPLKKLRQDVTRFLEVYKVLSAEGKAQFEAQMAGAIKDYDEKTRKLYVALLQAAKDGKGIEEAIQEMGKAS